MTARCTWVGCARGGPFEQRGSDGSVWAHLCADHRDELEAALSAAEPGRIASGWVKAQGGARAAADRMKPTIDAAARLVTALASERA